MRLVFASVFTAVLLAAPAMAEPLPEGGVTWNQVSEVLEARGYPAELSWDEYDDPRLASTADGTEFSVVFYDCQATVCAGIQFAVSYDRKEGLSADQINDWNRAQRFGRGFIDADGDVYVQMDVELRRGASTELLDSNLDTWLSVMGHVRELVAE